MTLMKQMLEQFQRKLAQTIQSILGITPVDNNTFRSKRKLKYSPSFDNAVR